MAGAYFVYVLRSETTGRRYVGSCQDIAERLQRRNAGDSESTKHGNLWKLVHSESFMTRAAAIQHERFYKTGVGREYLDRLERLAGSITSTRE